MTIRRGLVSGAVLALVAMGAPPAAGAVAPLEWTDPGRFTTVARVAADPAIDLGPDGTLYVLDRAVGAVSTVEDGRGAPVPGTEQLKAVDVDAVEGAVYLLTETELWQVTDGVPTLLSGTLTEATSLAVDATGGVYVAEYLPSGDDRPAARIRKRAPDGTITTVAGEGARRQGDHDFDGSPATEVRLQRPRGLAIDAQGALYFTDYPVSGSHHVVMTIGVDGKIREFSDVSLVDHQVDDGGLAVGADGRVYVLDDEDGVGGVRVLAPDGQTTSLGPNVFAPRDIAVRPDGGVYVAAQGRILLSHNEGDSAPDVGPGADPWADQDPGAILTVAGPASDPGRLALGSAPKAFAVGTDGAVHVVENGRLRTVLGSTELSDRLAEADFGAVTVTVTDIAPAADGALFVNVDAMYKKSRTASPTGPDALTLLVHPDQDETPILLGGPRLPNSEPLLPMRMSGAGGRLYLAFDTGPVRVVARDGSLRDVATRAGLTPFTVAADGAVYHLDDRGRVSRLEPGGRSEPVVGEVFNAPRDLAVAKNGTVYLATEDGIRAIAPDKTVSTVAPDKADRLAVDGHGNLYFADGKKLRVLVRPDQVTEFPWVFVTATAVALAVVGVGFLVFRVLRRRTQKVR